jgi:hypothetical protein
VVHCTCLPRVSRLPPCRASRCLQYLSDDAVVLCTNRWSPLSITRYLMYHCTPNSTVSNDTSIAPSDSIKFIWDASTVNMDVWSVRDVAQYFFCACMHMPEGPTVCLECRHAPSKHGNPVHTTDSSFIIIGLLSYLGNYHYSTPDPPHARML